MSDMDFHPLTNVSIDAEAVDAMLAGLDKHMASWSAAFVPEFDMFHGHWCASNDRHVVRRQYRGPGAHEVACIVLCSFVSNRCSSLPCRPEDLLTGSLADVLLLASGRPWKSDLVLFGDGMVGLCPTLSCDPWAMEPVCSAHQRVATVCRAAHMLNTAWQRRCHADSKEAKHWKSCQACLAFSQRLLLCRLMSGSPGRPQSPITPL